MDGLDSRLKRDWWGRHLLPTGRSLAWQLGPLTLYVEHRPYEIRLHWIDSGEPSHADLSLSHADEAPHNASSTPLRYALPGDEAHLALSPRLADRSVIARPTVPLLIPAQQSVALFVSTPLWVALTADALPGYLMDVPSFRLSDSWFGPSPRDGELCYACVTQARLDPQRLPSHPVRAMTRIQIHNEAVDTLAVERVKIPTPYLQLFRTQSGELWTQAVHVHRRTLSGDVEMRLETPRGVADLGGESIASARKVESNTLFKRALDALIG